MKCPKCGYEPPRWPYCKVCGKRMQRTCDACKVQQRREQRSKMAEKRKAKRHAAKAALGVPRCALCRQQIKGAVRLNGDRFARKFCSNACRQAAFRDRSRQATEITGK